MSHKTLIIDLLRHGETRAGQCYIGTTDVPLTEKGWQQMQRLRLAEQVYDRVITSPLSRCAEFAQQYAAEHDLPLEMETGFREMCFGDWEGQSSETLWQQDRERLSAFWQNPLRHQPPGGESLAEFHHRVATAFRNRIEHFGAGSVLLVAHGGSIRSILAIGLSLPLENLHRLTIDHGSLSRVQVDYVAGEMLTSVGFINR